MLSGIITLGCGLNVWDLGVLDPLSLLYCVGDYSRAFSTSIWNLSACISSINESEFSTLVLAELNSDKSSFTTQTLLSNAGSIQESRLRAVVIHRQLFTVLLMYIYADSFPKTKLKSLGRSNSQHTKCCL